MIKIKRVYYEPNKSDGTRILVDRLWPRGLTKEAAKLDAWMKDIAPSNELRTWFHANREEWPEFRKRYRKELSDLGDSVDSLINQAKTHTLTLVFSGKDGVHNNAVVLAEYLRGILAREK